MHYAIYQDVQQCNYCSECLTLMYIDHVCIFLCFSYFTAWKGCMDVGKHWCRNVQQFKKMFAIVQERKATACKE